MVSTIVQLNQDSALVAVQVMVTKNRLPLVYDKSRPARFGILPKRPKSGKEVRWFELDPGAHVPTVPTMCPLI